MGSFYVQDVSWLPVVDAVAKATLLLAVAAICAGLLRRGSAAARHLVWTLALLSALALPILSIALPRWQVPLLVLDTAASSTSPPAQHSVSLAPPLRQRPHTAGDEMVTPPPQSDGGAPSPSTAAIATAQTFLSWESLLLIVWAAGLIAVFARLAVGMMAVHWLARRTQSAGDAPWIGLARRLATDVGVSPRVRFLRSARATMPMACGILRPAIVMPADADAWPAERLRIVLLHELAHVKRRDCLTHALAQITCALYWFNPLAWVAARQIRTERERACDDLVLAAGTRAPDYADQLLEIARVMRDGRFPAVLAGASLAMAYRSQLEGRLMAILDPKVPRSGVTRVRAAAAGTFFSLALLPLASVQPWAYMPEGTTTAAAEGGAVEPLAAPALQRVPQARPPRPVPAPAPVAAPAAWIDEDGAHANDDAAIDGAIESTTEGIVQGVVQGVVRSTAQGLAAGAIRGVAASLPRVGEDIEAHVAQDDHVRPSEGVRTRKAADPRTVEALKGALNDTDKDVRQAALHALVQLRDPSVYDVLIQMLRDEAADVRQQAAFGLGQLRDRRAAPALAAALKDAAADVRQQAVFALGQLRDPAALDPLIVAARDGDADVRRQAVFALGQLRDRRSVEVLISALKDSDADVRQQAAFALGQIRDRAALEALVVALKGDDTADVRQQAAFALGQLRDSRAIEGLTAALKDASAGVRQQAALALGQVAR